MFWLQPIYDFYDINIHIMKAKTILELATLSASLYTISKNTQIIEKMRQLAEEGKDKVNAFMKEHQVDEDGNDI